MTGTSTEYIGDRPLPRVLRDRAVVFVLGPAGSGKSTVARAILGDAPVALDNRACQAAIIERVRSGAWEPQLLTAPCLVLDGPVWLHHRPGAVRLLEQLLQLRSRAGLRTVVCQADADASATLLIDALCTGACAVVALRFPQSRKARLRAAERICSARGLPLARARRAVGLSDWSYQHVIEALRR